MNTIREDFEAFAKGDGLDLTRFTYEDGYRSALTADAWRIWQAARQPVDCHVAVAGAMPGTKGFTAAIFKAEDVPLGAKIYAAPPQQPERVDLSAFRPFVEKERNSLIREAAHYDMLGPASALAEVQVKIKECDSLLALINQQESKP